MPVRFDPYHKWFGIPYEEQPPNHYRLLGVQSFESDPDAISNAADQRMALLKTFAASTYSSLAEDLLDEVARARVCLLNLEKKRAYDSTLRDRLRLVSQPAQMPEGFWLPPQNGIADALDVTCPHCESSAMYDLAPISQLLLCKRCNKQMSLPGREDVARLAARLKQKSAPNRERGITTRSNELNTTPQHRDKGQVVPQNAASNIEAIHENWPQINPQLTPLMPDVGIIPYRRKKPRRSLFVSLLGIVFGGVAGLSAGYFVLCHIDRSYDFLHISSPENNGTQSPKTSGKTPGPRRPTIPKDLPPSSANSPKRQVPIVPQPENGGVPSVMPPDAPLPKVDVPKADLPKMSDKPSAIVTLNLDKPVIHINAESDKASNALCDVGFSHNLLHRGDARDGYEVVAKDLGHHGKATVELGANIQGAGAAIEITVMRRNNVVTCELRPLFSLPSGDIQPFTISRGTILHNRLSKLLSEAKSARDSLTGMQSNLSQLKSGLQSAQKAMSANGNTPAETAAARTAAMVQANNLNRQINALNKKIAAANQLLEREPAITKDLQSLNEIAEYAKGIASVSTVSVRFHSGDTTIPATVK